MLEGWRQPEPIPTLAWCSLPVSRPATRTSGWEGTWDQGLAALFPGRGWGPGLLTWCPHPHQIPWMRSPESLPTAGVSLGPWC